MTAKSVGPQCFGTAQKKPMQDIQTPDYPAPGTHKDIRFNKTNPPTWKFGRSTTTRDGFLCQHAKKYPAPNNYKNDNPQLRKTSPCWSFNRAQQSQQADVNSRFNYKPSQKTTKYKYPDYSFGYAQEMDYSTQVPPPSTYNPNVSQSKSFNQTQKSFTVMKRPNPYGQQATFPGVGEYDVTSKQIGSFYKFGTGDRPDGTVSKDSPGVYYQIAGDMVGAHNSKTMAPMYPMIPRDGIDFPSPCHYNPRFFNNTERDIITFSGKRSEIRNTFIDKFPSADKYANQCDISLINKKKSVTFHKSERKQVYDENPPPGTYEIKPVFNKTLGHMARKLNELTKDITPSGANYNPEDHLTKSSPQTPINLYSDRVDFGRSTTGKLGPGEYLKVNQINRSQLGKMSQSLKLYTRDNKYPAPGQYQIPGLFGRLPKYYCLPKKLDSNGNVLRVGTYNRSIKASLKQKKKQEQEPFQESLGIQE